MKPNKLSLIICAILSLILSSETYKLETIFDLSVNGRKEMCHEKKMSAEIEREESSNSLLPDNSRLLLDRATVLRVCRLLTTPPSPSPCSDALQHVFCSASALIQSIDMQCSLQNGTSTQCAKCLLEKAELFRKSAWIIKLLDSFGKLPAGISDGHFLWVGDYEQCTRINVQISAQRNLKGKYCTGYVGVPESGRWRSRERCRQPTSPRPDARCLTVQYGFCAPHACSSAQLTALFTKVLPTAACHSFVDCPQLNDDKSIQATIFLSFGSVLIALIVGGTVIDILICRAERTEHRETRQKQLSRDQHDSAIESSDVYYCNQIDWMTKVFLAFSVLRNGATCLSTKTASDWVHCLDGLRLLSIAWVVYAHSYYYAVCYLRNLSFSLDNASSFWYQPINSMTLSTDTFFVISGFLMALKWSKLYEKVKHLNESHLKIWLYNVLRRFIRIVPTYALTIAFTCTLFQYLASGPFWKGQDSNMIGNCQNNWWQNVLFLNNFFAQNETCLPWTWFLANDMQFQLFLPPLVFLLDVAPIAAALLSALLIGGSILLRSVVFARSRFLPALLDSSHSHVYLRAYDFLDQVFVKPYMRVGPYVIGILCGYLMSRSFRPFKLNKLIGRLIWTGIGAISSCLVFGLNSVTVDRHPLLVVLYSATYRSIWALLIATIIHLCCHGYGGGLNALLSWKVLTPLSNLTYIVYLIHELVFIYFYASIHRPIYATHWSMLWYATATMATSFGIAFLLRICFELPIQNLKQMTIDRWQRRTSQKPEEEERKHSVQSARQLDSFAQNT